MNRSTGWRSAVVGLVGMWQVVASAGLAATPRDGGQGEVREAMIPEVAVKSFADAAEVERIIATARSVPVGRRVPLISRYFLGRRYHPETKARVKKQHAKPKTKVEATNELPLPVNTLPTSLQYLDCMTFVEHVLALAAADRPDYVGAFLPCLIDVMYDAGGGPLLNHLRNHFTSHWADVNERKGYLVNVARGHPAAVKRVVLLNRVGANRTFYIEDRFMIAREPQIIHYFPTEAVVARRVPFRSGDIVALVCAKEGLDVLHMGFAIEHGRQWLLRHASSKLNRIIEEDLAGYLKGRPEVIGLMVLRPRLAAPPPPRYRFRPKGGEKPPVIIKTTVPTKARPTSGGRKRSAGPKPPAARTSR